MKKKAMRTLIENGKQVTKEVTVIMDNIEKRPAPIEEAKSPIKIIDLTETIKPEQMEISIDTNATATFFTIMRVPVEGEKVIDLSKYAFKKKAEKEVMLSNLLEKMRAVDIIPARIEVCTGPDVNYYYVPETLTNQLGWYFGCGATVVIDGVEFKPLKVKPVFKYKIENRHLPEHFKKWLKKDTFTMDDIKAYNNYVNEEVHKNRREAWAHAEYFYRLVQTTNFDRAVVYQPNKKVYKELTAHQWLDKQLLQLLPASKIVRDNVKLKKGYKNNKPTFQIDYKATDTEELFQQLTLSEVEQAELSLKRNAYGLGDDNIHYIETNEETEHGYALSIPQVYLNKTTRNISSGYAGGDFSSQTSSNTTKNVSIYSTEERFEAKAYMNYHILKEYEALNLLDMDYEYCPICGQPTRKRKPVCDSCGTNLAEQEIANKTLELYAQATRIAEKEGYELKPEMFEQIQNAARMLSEYNLQDEDDISFNILKSK